MTRVVRVPGLHEAMLAGVLDDYRARVVAAELGDVPVDLARTVPDALGADLTELSGPALRRRTRAILFRLSPDLLRERIRKARAEVGLRRWVGEPGIDAWSGRFPSEHAATAWAAIDALARRYRAEGACSSLEQARAHALLDLVHGRATITTTLTLTVPADTLTAEGEQGESEHLDGATGALGQGASVSGESTQAQARPRRRVSPERLAGAPTRSRPPRVHVPVDDALGGDMSGASAASSPTASAPHAGNGHDAGAGTSVVGQDGLDRSATAFVGASGTQGSAISWVPRSWLWEHAAATISTSARCGRPGAVPPMVCHPDTGALLDPGDALATLAYRPGERLKAVVRARDARCRFPGCTIAARSCDLDHVKAWPHGPTSATNLICLCRRHHRVKQRRRWSVTLLPDARVIWRDPRGHQLTTWPIDHLGSQETRSVRGSDTGLVQDTAALDDTDGVPVGDAPAAVSTVVGTDLSHDTRQPSTTPIAESRAEVHIAAAFTVIAEHHHTVGRAGSRAEVGGCRWARAHHAGRLEETELDGRVAETMLALRGRQQDRRRCWAAIDISHVGTLRGVGVVVGGDTLTRHESQPPPQDPPPF